MPPPARLRGRRRLRRPPARLPPPALSEDLSASPTGTTAQRGDPLDMQSVAARRSGAGEGCHSGAWRREHRSIDPRVTSPGVRSGRVVPLLLDAALRASRGWGEGPVSGANKGPRCDVVAPISESPEPPLRLSASHTTGLPSTIASTLWSVGTASGPASPGPWSSHQQSWAVTLLPPARPLDVPTHPDIELSGSGVATAVSLTADGGTGPRWLSTEGRKEESPPDGRGIRARSDRVPCAATRYEQGA